MSEQYECDIVKVPTVISENSEGKKSSLGKESEQFEHIVRGNNVEKFECLSLLIKNNNGGNNWEKIKTLLSSYSTHSLSQSDQTSQVSYHNNFFTFLFCDKTFKSTFQLNPVSNST